METVPGGCLILLVNKEDPYARNPIHLSKDIEQIKLVKPSIAITVRFTPVLHEWLTEVSKREGISFNQVVLQCCKNAKDQYVEVDRLEENG